MREKTHLARGKTQIFIKVVENGKVSDKGTFDNISSARRFMQKY